jgi:hypothetical protein
VASSSSGGPIKAAQQLADEAAQQQQRQADADSGVAQQVAAGAEGIISKAAEAAASAKDAVADAASGARQILQEELVQPTQDWAGTLQAQQQPHKEGEWATTTASPTTASAAVRLAEQQRLQHEKEHGGVLAHLQQLPQGALQFARSVADEISAAAADVAGLARGAVRRAPSHAAGAAEGVASRLIGSIEEAATPAAPEGKLHLPREGVVDAAKDAAQQVKEVARDAAGKVQEISQPVQEKVSMREWLSLLGNSCMGSAGVLVNTPANA